jgi:hypothetical protein
MSAASTLMMTSHIMKVEINNRKKRGIAWYTVSDTVKRKVFNESFQQ